MGSLAHIRILTGPVESGKTSFLREALARSPGAASPAADGYLSLRVPGPGRTEGYDLFALGDASIRPFLRRKGGADWPKVGPYSLVPETLALAGRIIRESRAGRLLVVDEIGPLEMTGSGVWPALSEVLGDGGREILLVVRDVLLKTCLGKLAGHALTVHGPADGPALRAFLAGTDIAVEIRFFATFKSLFWSGERTMRFPAGAAVLDLLRALGDTLERRGELFDGEALRPHIVVLVNGTSLPAATGLETPLAEGDAVSIFPLLGGG